MYHKQKKDYAQIIIDQCREINIDLEVNIAKKLEADVKLINRWNRTYNLTAVKDLNSLINKHIVDSLTVLSYLKDNSLILDVGTGAGLPGVPLAIVNPSLKIHLLDCNGKKICFLRQAIADLGLNNVEINNTRLEDYKPTKNYDFIVTRAFASLAVFYDGVKHIMSDNTQLIAMKGSYPAAELDEVNIQCRIDKKDLPGDFAVQRHIVLMSGLES